MTDRARTDFHKRVFLAAVVVHAITAWCSSGFYAADEHYQVIVFAQAKLGDPVGSELPWEFAAHIRSAMLPTIASVAIGACRAWITSDPFLIAFLLRALTAVVALFIVRRFVNVASRNMSEKHVKAFILLSYFLWFLPYQHARFSSETWSGLLFLSGLSSVLGDPGRKRSVFLAGILFGLCVQLKPAMMPACGAALGWMLLDPDTRRATLVHSLSGGMLALALGVLVDSWFYGGPTHTLWNYMYKNSLSISKVHPLPVLSESYPLYYYFPWIIKYAIAPIGLAITAALVWLTIRNPRSILVWILWPSLIMLSIIPHKELRFLFPFVDLVPLLLILAWEQVPERVRSGLVDRRWAVPVGTALLLLNGAGLAVASTSPAGSGRTRLASALPTGKIGDPIRLGYALDSIRIWEVRIPSFYLPEAVTDIGSISADPSPGYASPELIITADGPSTPPPGYHLLQRSGPMAWEALLRAHNRERHGPYMLYRREARSSPPSEL